MRSRLSIRIIVTAKNLNVKENQFSVVRLHAPRERGNRLLVFGQVIWTDDVLLRKPKDRQAPHKWGKFLLALCFSTFLCCVAG